MLMLGLRRCLKLDAGGNLNKRAGGVCGFGKGLNINGDKRRNSRTICDLKIREFRGTNRKEVSNSRSTVSIKDKSVAAVCENFYSK